MGKKKEPDVIIKEGAPGWMVSFSDLNTLLLTFFILLLVFAKRKEHGLIAAGLGAFRKAFVSNGLNGIFKGRIFAFNLRETRPHFLDYKKEGEIYRERYRGDEVSLGDDTEALKEKEQGSNIFIPLPGSFEKGDSIVPFSVKKEISRIAATLTGNYKVSIQAFAGTDEGKGLDIQRLAKKRAFAVANEFLKLGIPEDRLFIEGKIVKVDAGNSGRAVSRSIKIKVTR